MAYNYGVKNTDPNFVIDPVTRAITQKSGKSRLMQHDHNSECYGFQIPRFIDGHDMSLCNVRIHYINISTNKSDRNSDLYPVTDVSVSGENVVFSWLVSKNATEYSGVLNFTIEFNRSTNDIVDYSWHTDIFKSLTISDTIENDVSEEVESYSDILTQWQNSLFGIADTEEASIKSVSATEQAAIEAKGAATLATIPEDYTATYNMANDAVRTKADGIVQTAEGGTIFVSDSSDDHIRGLRIFGKSMQKKTTGSQLCHFPDVESYICEGVTWHCNDGVVTVKGTSTAISSSSKEIKYNFPIEAGKYYLLGHSSDVMMLCCVTDSEGTLHYYQHVFILDGTEKSALIYCQIDSGKTVNETIYPMVSVTDGAEFESYSGGFTSPSKNWPQEIKSLSNAEITIIGKNLVNVVEEEIKVYKLYDLDLPAGTYTFSAIVTSNDTDANECLAVFKPSDDSNIYVRLPRNTRQFMTFTSDLPIVRMDLYAGNNYASSDGDVAVWKDVQLEFGDKATEYQAHTKQTIGCSRVIPGVPVESNGNYTDENSQQWICDEVDIDRGLYIQRIKTHVFNGSESWSQHATINTLYYVWMEDGALNGMSYPSLCSHYEYEPGELANVNSGHRFNNNGSGKAQLFYIKDDTISSLSELKAWLSANYESGTPVSIAYPLFTPIETPLTEAELATFKSLHTNYPNTTILNNAGAHMQVKYNADTKLYIDNKFAELASMMTSNT